MAGAPEGAVTRWQRSPGTCGRQTPEVSHLPVIGPWSNTDRPAASLECKVIGRGSSPLTLGRIMLRIFLGRHREALIDRCRSKVATRRAPRATEHELHYGIPMFL